MHRGDKPSPTGMYKTEFFTPPSKYIKLGIMTTQRIPSHNAFSLIFHLHVGGHTMTL